MIVCVHFTLLSELCKLRSRIQDDGSNLRSWRSIWLLRVVGLPKAGQKLLVGDIVIILSYTWIYKRAQGHTEESICPWCATICIFVVSYVRFSDVMRVPLGQPHACNIIHQTLSQSLVAVKLNPPIISDMRMYVWWYRTILSIFLFSMVLCRQSNFPAV